MDTSGHEGREWKDGRILWTTFMDRPQVRIQFSVSATSSEGFLVGHGSTVLTNEVALQRD